MEDEITTYSQDSTYIVEAEIVQRGDTIFYQIDKKDLRELYHQVFYDMLDEDAARDHLVLTFTYIPLILVFVLLITAANMRWNKAYRRIKNAQEKVPELSEEDMTNIRKLDLQYYRVTGRIFFFVLVWFTAAVIDSLFTMTGVFKIPWAAIFTSLYSAWKVLKRLVEGSTLAGIDDRDLMNQLGGYVKTMIVETLFEKLKNIISKNDQI